MIMTSDGCTKTPLSHFLLKIQKPVYIVQAHSLLDGGALLYMNGVSKT